MGDRVLAERSRLLAGLTVAYSIMALAALSRSAYQLATGDASVLAASLSGLAGLIYLVAALGLRLPVDRGRPVVLGSCSAELIGVLLTSLVELVVGGFGRPVVWSGLGYGYGFLPILLPALGIWSLRRIRTTGSFPPAATHP